MLYHRLLRHISVQYNSNKDQGGITWLGDKVAVR